MIQETNIFSFLWKDMINWISIFYYANYFRCLSVFITGILSS